MFNIDQHKSLRLCRSAVVAIAALVVFGPLAAWAQAASDDAFSARISEKEKMLTSTDATSVTNSAMVNYLETDTNFQRTVFRSTPWVEVTNAPASTDAIQQVIMTLADSQYQFGSTFLGDYAVVGKTTPGITIDPSVTAGGSELIINFPDGLLSGQTVRFRIDLDDTTDAASFPDYRDVLLAPAGGSASSGDYATISAVYVPSVGDPITVGPEVFLDDRSDVNIESTVTASSGGCCCGGSGGPLDMPFIASGQSGTIPEPSSIVLCLAGLLGAVGLCRRGRDRGHGGRR